MNCTVVEITELSELKKVFPLLKELRPHLSIDEYMNIYQEARSEGGYTLVGAVENSEFIALMGYRILHDFVRGRHLYIDDLVVSETIRSKGIGAALLKHAEKIAAEKNCKVLRLCTGIENTRGAQFYENNLWSKRAFAYTKKI